MAEELSEYDKYNTLNAQLEGTKKPKKEEPNKYENYRQKQEKSGKQDVIEGRSMDEYTPTSFMGSKDNGPAQIALGQDLNETRAHYQSGTENIFSGLTKGTGLMGTTLANTFVGLPYGIIKASYDGLSENTKSKGEVFSDIYDNEFTRGMDTLNKKTEELFPNYYSEKEQKASAFSADNIANTNFWGDKVLKNAGFTAGAILGGGIISKGIRGSSYLAKAFIGANNLTEGGLSTAFKALIDGGMDAASAAKKVTSGVRALNATAALTTSAWVSAGEASGEAIQTKQELKQALDDRYKLEHGTNEIPLEESAYHDKLASNAGNSVFAANIALLMGTESYQFSKLWAKGFTPELARAEKLALDGVGKAIVKQPKLATKLFKSLANTASNGLAESFEEGAQTALQAGNKDYFGRQYDKDSLSHTNSIVDSTLTGLQEAFGTKDGIESMLLGTITGIGSHVATSGLSSILGKVRAVESDDSRTQTLADAINSKQERLTPFVKSITRGESINRDKQDNLNSDNPSRVLHENYTNDEFKNIVQPFIESDRFDLLEDKLNNEFQKDDEEFKNDNPDTQLNKKSSKEYVAKLLQDAKKLKDNWENIDEMFPKADPNIKSMLWSTMSDIQNKDSRIKSLALDVAKNSGILFNDNAEEYLQKVKEAYDKDPSSLDINKARDVVELDTQKKAQIEGYKKLLDPNYQAQTIKEVEAKEEEKKNHVPEPSLEESTLETPQATQNDEEDKPIANDEIVQPEASNEVNSSPIDDNQEQINTKVEGARQIVKNLQEKGESNEDIIEGLTEAATNADDITKAAFTKVINELRGDNNQEDLTPEQIDKVNEKVEAKLAEEDSNDEPPTIIEDDNIHSDYNEMDRMSSTAFRTTANHQEAIDEGLNSVLRYQNFINNPNTSLTGLRLMVVTPQSSLYTKVQNKKQKAFEDKKKAEGKTIDGIYAVVVDENNNLVVADTSGEISRKIKSEEVGNKAQNSEIDEDTFKSLATTYNNNTGDSLMSMALIDSKGPGRGSVLLKGNRIFSQTQIANDKFSEKGLTSKEKERLNKQLTIGKTILDKFNKVVARVKELIEDPNSNYPHGVGISPVKDETLSIKYGLNEEEIKVLRKNYGISLNTSLAEAIEDYSYFLLGEELDNKELSRSGIDKLRKSGYYKLIIDYHNSLFNIVNDVDNELEGILVTTLVSNAESKESGFNAVSYANFGRQNGIEGTGVNKSVTEEDIKNKNHPAYIAWNDHKQSLAFTRKGITDGNVRYLSIQDSSPGIFQNNKLANPIGETLGIDINDSRLSFHIPKVENISSKEGTTVIGKVEGLNKDYTVKVGKPYLIYNGKLFPLNARRLSGNEVENVAKMFELAIANPDRQKYFLGKIKELVYIKPSSMKSILSGELKGDDLRDYLKDRYRQVDANALQTNPKSKYQISSITDKGVNTKKEESTYRDFILAGNEPAITINYNPHPTTVKDKPNYLNGYLVYSPVVENIDEEEVSDKLKAELELDRLLTNAELDGLLSNKYPFIKTLIAKYNVKVELKDEVLERLDEYRVTAGEYHPDTNKIVMDINNFNEKTLVHELIHAILYNATNTNNRKDFRNTRLSKELTVFYNSVVDIYQDSIKDRDLTAEDLEIENILDNISQGLQSQEIVTYALTRPEFTEWLNSHKSKEELQKPNWESLWGWFVDILTNNTFKRTKLTELSAILDKQLAINLDRSNILEKGEVQAGTSRLLDIISGSKVRVESKKEEVKAVTPEEIVEAPKPKGKRVYKPIIVEDEGLLRKSSLSSSDKKEDLPTLKKWFEDRFDGESFKVVDSLINGNAFGEYTSAGIKLFSGAEEGTGYHEAFHKVTQEYLSEKEIKSLYDNVRRVYKNAANYTDLECEETLAEEFRLYVLNGAKPIGELPLINRFFKRIYNWIRSLVTGKTTPEQVYNKLASKKGYTGAKKFNVQQFTKLDRGAIKGLTHAQTANIVESVNAHFFNILFDSKKTPDQILSKDNIELVNKAYDITFKRIVNRDFAAFVRDADEYSDEEYNAIADHYDFLLNIKDGVPTSLNSLAIEAHINYLKGLGIVLKLKEGKSQQEREREEEETEVDESDEVEADNAESEDRSRDSAYDKNSNEESSMYSAPNSIKLLVMSLPKIDSDGNPVANNIGGPALNDFRQTMNLLYSNLNGLSQFYEMYSKMEELSSRFPVFKELLNRLGEPGSNKSREQFLLENDFRQAFSKFESRGTITLINPENGEVYQVDANANKLKDRIKENWTSNLRILAKDKNSFIEAGDDGILRLTDNFTEGFKSLIKDNNYKEALHQIGIDFTDLSQQKVQDMLTTEPTFRDDVNFIYKELNKLLKDKTAVNNLFAKTSNIGTNINNLLDIESEISKETVELSYISAEGKRIYAVSLNNYYSLVVNALNNAKTKSELFEKYPHLNNPYTQNSVWIKNLFDNKGNKIPGQSTYMNTVSGLKQQDDNDSGIGATKMEPSDKIVQEFNDLLTTGSTSLIRAADKSSEYAFGITNYGKGQKLAIPLLDISKEGFETSKVHEIFFGYFMDELNSIRAFRGDKKVGANIAIYGQPLKNKDGSIIKGSEPANNFRLFSDILSPETLSELEVYKTNEEEIDGLLEAKINKELVTYLEQYAKDTKQYMQDRKVGLKSEKGFTGISTTIATTEKELDNAIKTFTANHLIQMQEQAKLLIGDSAFYKDKIKRISAGTGTKKFAASSKLTDNWFNNFYKNEVGRADNKTANGKLNVVIFDDVKAQLDTFDDYVQALVDKGVSEEKAKEILSAYKNMDEGDAQGWITLDEYREFFMRVGGAYWTEQHEAQYRHERALEAKDKDEVLTPWMIKALEKNPEFYFMPIKAQHMGPQNIEGLYAPAFHKYSLSPLYHSLVKGRNMEKMLDSMRDRKVGYALFGSGSKVGTPLNSEGKLPAFYNKEGEMNGVQLNTPIQSINYENLGIQLDIAPKVKESLIFGSQTRKLLFSNLFGESPKEWAKPLAESYNKIIDDLVTFEFDKLTKKLGLKVSKNEDGSYKSFTFNGDYRKLVNQLKDQLEDKDTADNILDSLQVNEDGSLKYPIDSLVNRSKIESMLFTIVNSKVIKQKMNGNALVQLASSGFENTSKREVGQSNYLKFYERGKNKTLAMEVEVPMNKNFAPLLNKYKTIEGVNKAITEGKIDSKHLQMIGYRIPTQGLNSMDVMTIKRFMPSESGIAIILPTGVVAKSGGDYDIDKLNIFMPNLFYDEKTDYVGSHALSKNTQGQDYKKAAQNKIIDIMSEVLTHPDNFIDLTTPNTTDDLVNLTAKIREAQGKKGADKASMTKQFRFDYLMEQFTYFLGGKAALGIAATHNTHHVVSQIAGVKLNASLPFKHNKSEDQIDLGQIYTQGKQKITDIINQFINAYVDVAKDPFYKDLNAGTEVASVWMYMLRAGVDLETIGYFMTQPIILEYVNARKLNKSLVTTSSDKSQGERFVDLSDSGRAKIESRIENSNDVNYKRKWQQVLDNGSIYNDLLKKYGNSNGKYRPQDFSGDNAKEDLRSLIAGEDKNGNFKDAQTYLLEKFLDIENQSSELTKLMQATNNDTTKIQNYGSVFKREQAESEVRDINRKGNIIPTGTIEDIHNKTIVGSFNKTKEFKDMYKELTLYTKYPYIKRVIDELVSEIPSKADWDKEYTKIQNHFIGYLLQKYGKTIDRESISSKVSLLSGDNSLAKQLISLRKDRLIEDNPFFDQLVGIVSEYDKGLDNVKLYSRRMSAYESNIMTEAFRSMLESNNPRVVEFAQDLAYATILQSGLQNSAITFTELIPFDFYNNLANQVIKNVGEDNQEQVANEFTNAYYHNINSKYGFRLQDYGIKEEDTLPKISEEQVAEDKVLPQQDDSVLDTDEGLSPAEYLEILKEDTKVELINQVREIRNDLSTNVKIVDETPKLFNPSVNQNAIREANKISDKIQEDGDANKICNLS